MVLGEQKQLKCQGFTADKPCEDLDGGGLGEGRQHGRACKERKEDEKIMSARLRGRVGEDRQKRRRTCSDELDSSREIHRLMSCMQFK